MTRTIVRSTMRLTATAIGVAAAAYATYVFVTWRQYGRPAPAPPDEQDVALDHFMPLYDIAERHSVRVAASAAKTFAAARQIDLLGHPAVRAIVRAREIVLGAGHEPASPSRGLIEDMQSLGWVVLAETPGREIVMGAITRPWESNVRFTGVPGNAFAEYAPADSVKIAWTLRADPIDASRSVFRTETRAVATDPAARAKFRRYWALLSPGILLIRRVTLTQVRRAAERRESSCYCAHPS